MKFDKYDKYQLEWLISHKHSLFDVIKEVSEYAEEYDGEDNLSFVDFFRMWEMDCGFGGELYACFGEWFDGERIDDDNVPTSATCGDYSPSCPWGAEGMSVSDFI